jgi:hypothetical protein
MFGLVVLGIINTIWIYLYNYKARRNNSFLRTFGILTAIDLLAYEIAIIVIKTVLFYLIVRTDDIPKWKRCLVAVITALPWV